MLEGHVGYLLNEAVLWHSLIVYQVLCILSHYSFCHPQLNWGYAASVGIKHGQLVTVLISLVIGLCS